MLNRFGDYLVQHWNAEVGKNGIEYRFNCPNCNDIKKHFSFNIEKGVSNCFRCGYRPLPKTFLIEKAKLDYNTVIELLEKATVVSNGFMVNKNCNQGIILPEGYEPINKLRGGLKVLMDKWLQENNITYACAEKLELGVVTKQGTSYSNRLIIPVFENNKLIYWMARVLVGNIEPKYLFPAISRKGIIWGLDSFDCSDGELYICEGWKDAYRVGGLAVFGKSIDVEQRKKIISISRSSGVKISILFDADAKKESYKVAVDLSKNVDVSLYYLNTKHDPGQCRNKEEVKMLSDVYDISSIVGRMQARHVVNGKKKFK